MLSQIVQLRTTQAGHGDGQKVGWLELFYDLVYVATIIALGNKLSEDSSTEGVLAFAAQIGADLFLEYEPVEHQAVPRQSLAEE